MIFFSTPNDPIFYRNNPDTVSITLFSSYFYIRFLFQEIQRPLINPDKIMWPKIESGLSKK